MRCSLPEHSGSCWSWFQWSHGPVSLLVVRVYGGLLTCVLKTDLWEAMGQAQDPFFTDRVMRYRTRRRIHYSARAAFNAQGSLNLPQSL